MDALSQMEICEHCEERTMCGFALGRDLDDEPCDECKAWISPEYDEMDGGYAVLYGLNKIVLYNC